MPNDKPEKQQNSKPTNQYERNEAELANDDFGYLRINVTTAGGALPVAGAMITVKSTDEGGGGVIAVMYTDRAGVSERIRLPAPKKSNAFEPGGEAPYTFYNIDTDKEGYYSTYNIFVPIYAEVTAIQPINLIPLARGVEYEGNAEGGATEQNSVPNL